MVAEARAIFTSRRQTSGAAKTSGPWSVMLKGRQAKWAASIVTVPLESPR